MKLTDSKPDAADLYPPISGIARYLPGATHSYSTVLRGKARSDLPRWVARGSKIVCNSWLLPAIHTYIRVTQRVRA